MSIAKEAENILVLKNICKTFPGVKALDDVSFTVRKGEVHALLGENGAGKSTLIKIISGVYIKDSGEIWYNGVRYDESSTAQMLQSGISTVHQELKMVETLSIWENIFMGTPLLMTHFFGKVIDKKEMRRYARELVDSMGVSVDVNEILGNLSVAKKQIIEICKALNHKAKLIIMDEPSATLTEAEIEILFKVIRKLRDEHVTVIYISHRLEEIFELADRLTVLRDGRSIVTGDVSDFDRNKLIHYMVGREITSIYPPKSCNRGEKILEVSKLSTKGVLKDISFTLYRGEILGITGLIGSGRSEVLRSIFGADSYDSGEMTVEDHKVDKHTIITAIRHSIGLVPEERKVEGFVPGFTVSQNLTLVGINNILTNTFLDKKKEWDAAVEYITKLHVVTPGPDTIISDLSGGNQQKVVIAKWLFVDSDILIFDEPTRGIDVGAKQEIYRILVDLAERGKAVLIVSSELPEILGVCNRILVMHDGRITAEYHEDEEVTQEQIMNAATL